MNMVRRKDRIMTSIVSIYVMISIIGCTFAWEAIPNASFNAEDFMDPVASAVDEHYRIIEPVLMEHDESFKALRTARGEMPSGREVVENMLEEQKGEEYLRFTYTLLNSSDHQDVLQQAQQLIPEEEYEKLLEEVDRTTRGFNSFGEEVLRDLPPSQEAAFLRDLQKLMTKSIVLLVAGIVYAAIPGFIFWGKVTAAAAISIAAGVLATTILALYRYYTLDEMSMAESFQEWITDVTTDSSAAYAVAASMITVGKSMGHNAVVTGLILVVFAIYNVIDMVKPMLDTYNFDA